MKFPLVHMLSGILLLNLSIKADVPLPGVDMPDKVKSTFTFISRDYKNSNLARLMQERKENRLRTQSSQGSVMNISLPLLLGTYANTRAVHGREALHDQIFADNPNGTMIDYYREISYGQLELSGQSFGWYALPETRSYYNSMSADGARFTLDLVKLADADVDFSQFDSDRDGYVDVVMIAHTGAGAETGADDIWSHSWSLNSARSAYPTEMPQGEYTTNDPRPGFPGQFVKINDYIIQPEMRDTSDDSIIEIGVFCHEFGHALGLPDLYDTDYSSAGIGCWGLMSSGSYGGDGRHPETPVHMCAWSKAFLGWVEPVIVDSERQQLEILNSAEHREHVYQLWMNGTPGREYFLIENRQTIGFDRYLPQSGLLIWHIDDHITRLWAPNSNENHKGVDLEAADGRRDLDLNVNEGDSGDPFPGLTNNRLFNSSTNPNSLAYDGRDSGVAIQIDDVVDRSILVNFLLTPEMFVTPKERFVAYDRGAIQFDVKNMGGGQMRWRATTTESWLSLEEPDGVGRGLLTVHVDANAGSESRTGFITLTELGSGDTEILTIYQSAAGEWNLRLTVSDRGGESVELQFGQFKSATDALDDGLGEAALTLAPQPGAFDARFVLPGNAELMSRRDFRTANQDYVEWRVTFQPGPGGAPIVLAWDPQSLPNVSFYAMDEFTGALISVNMRDQKELTIPTASLKSLKIVRSTVGPSVVNTTSGWNLVSMPVWVDDMRPKSIFPSSVSSAFAVQEHGYGPVDQIAPGHAYWLKFNAAGHFRYFGTPAIAHIPVARGWNMIGPFDQPVNLSDITAEPIDLGITDILEYDDAYRPTDHLLPGKGYWLKASDNGVLFLDGADSVRGSSSPANFGMSHPPFPYVDAPASRMSDQIAEIDIPLVIQDAAGRKRTLWFGLASAASSQIDRHLAEEELPPLPPVKVFDARFISENVAGADIGLGSYRDYRNGDDSFAGTVVYELRFQSTDNSKITLSWDLPDRVSGHLADLNKGGFINKKMSGQGELGVSLVNIINRLVMTITFQARPSLLVVSPNGGEMLEIGSTAQLQWDSAHVDGNVTISLSRDNGATFDLLATTANTGSFIWTVTPPASQVCLLKISTPDGTLLDQSDAVFSVTLADGVQSVRSIPSEFALQQNYPNPFNPITRIDYQLPLATAVRLVILNSRGQVIRTMSEASSAGYHSVFWDGRTDAGDLASSGLYLFRLEAGDFVQTRKMILLR